MATEDDSEWLLRKPPSTFELSFLEVSLQQIWCSQSPFRITSVELLAPITQFCEIQATLVIGIDWHCISATAAVSSYHCCMSVQSTDALNYYNYYLDCCLDK